MMQARRKIHDTGVQYSETTTNYGFDNEHEARDKRCFIEDFCTCEVEERISQQYLYSSDPESRQAMLKKMMAQDTMDDPSKSQVHSRKMLYPQKSETLVDHHEVSP